MSREKPASFLLHSVAGSGAALQGLQILQQKPSQGFSEEICRAPADCSFRGNTQGYWSGLQACFISACQ